MWVKPSPFFHPHLLAALKNATFQITPDMIKESENIQLGQDLKLSCHVDAVPQEKVNYQWFKNGKPARTSKRLLVTRNDPELPAVTSSLELIDLHFSDYGTYLCMASFPGSPVPDLSIEVNISSETGESIWSCGDAGEAQWGGVGSGGQDLGTTDGQTAICKWTSRGRRMPFVCATHTCWVPVIAKSYGLGIA